MGVFDWISSSIDSSVAFHHRRQSEIVIRKVFQGQPQLIDFTCNGGFIAADAEARRFIVFCLQPTHETASLWIDESNFMSAEVVANYEQHGTTRIQGKSGEAMLGAALFGVTGAVIGGAGARNAQSQGTMRESGGILNIYIRNVTQPLVTLEFPIVSTARTWWARLMSLPGRNLDADTLPDQAS